jgi:prevent-host-death family protein
MVTNGSLMTMKKRAEKRVPAGEFKAKCLALFDLVEAHQHTFVVTKRGRPVARIVPIAAAAPHSLHGTLLHEDELLAPIDVKWESAP